LTIFRASNINDSLP